MTRLTTGPPGYTHSVNAGWSPTEAGSRSGACPPVSQ